jgi:DNA-binding LytR/AlgR family response regulator
MPVLNGLDLLRSLPRPPHVIITTAYSEYALLGYELAVSDYLLKPFAFGRFLKAVNRVVALHQARQPRPDPAPAPAVEPAALFLKSGKHIQQFQFDTLSHLEGWGNYVRLHVQDQRPVLVHETLSAVLALLPAQRFVRIHKSFVVALDKIDRLAANAVHLGGVVLPVGNTYKQALQQAFAKRMPPSES